MHDGFEQTNKLVNMSAVLEQVRIEFKLRLQRQFGELQSVRAGLEYPDECCELEALQFTAHKISGIAKTIGYENLGLAAAELEAEIANVGVHPSDKDIIEISRLLDAMLLEMLAVLSEAPS